MFNKKTVAPLLAALALATAPIAAQAADHEGFYAFGGIGATGIEGELSTKEKSVKQNDTVSSLQAGAGYRWNRHLAVEVEAHSTLGKADLLELGKVSSYGMRGAVVGIVPLGDRFELVGKLYVGNERSHWREGSVKPYWVKTNEPNKAAPPMTKRNSLTNSIRMDALATINGIKTSKGPRPTRSDKCPIGICRNRPLRIRIAMKVDNSAWVRPVLVA